MTPSQTAHPTEGERELLPRLSEEDLSDLRIAVDQCEADAVDGDDEGHVERLRTLVDRLALSTHPSRPQGESTTYQKRIDDWMREMFAAGGADLRTRMDRLIEEVFELAQAHDYDPARIGTIRDYVYGRPKGEPRQEMGGVMVTLASFACSADIDMMGEAERELERINTPEIRAKIMAKQASKNGLHTPLPTAEAAVVRPQGEEGQTDLDRAWRAVDACGGSHTRADRESGYARGYDEALTFACAEIEKLGGRRS